MAALRDRVQQPGAGLRVVDLDLDAVAGDRGGERLGQRLRRIDGRDGEPGRAQARRDPPQPHGIVRLGPVVHVVFREHRAGVDDVRLQNVRTDEPTERIDTKILEVVMELDNAEGLVPGLRVMGCPARPAGRPLPTELRTSTTRRLRLARLPPSNARRPARLLSR